MLSSSSFVIVSRHGATPAYCREYLRGLGVEDVDSVVHIAGNATEDDVRGKIVVGNVPMHLGALALEVHAVEYPAFPPRGAEYSIEDMIAAGVRVSVYVISRKD